MGLRRGTTRLNVGDRPFKRGRNEPLGDRLKRPLLRCLSKCRKTPKKCSSYGEQVSRSCVHRDASDSSSAS